MEGKSISIKLVWAEWLPLVALLFSFIACYYQTFQWLNHKYSAADSYYSHGYLIPIISIYIIYQNRTYLKNLALSSSSFGVIIIVCSLLFHIVGVLGDINFISSFSMVFYIIGCLLYLLGKDFIKALIFPLFYLFFMCPLPNSVIDLIGLPTKSMATSLALYFVDFAGIPYIREGFRIILSDASFLVGTPCNGMRSLISFLALGVLFVSFLRTSNWKKIVFIILIYPLSIALNGLRIAILIFIAHLYGQDAASPESYLHDLSGLLVFIIGLALFLIYYRWLDEKKSA